MHPVLLDFGSWRITSYGLALTLGFAAGIALGLARAPRHGLERRPIVDLSIVVIVASLLGSRVFYALLHRDQYASWVDVLEPTVGGAAGAVGLSVMGGLPVALVAAWTYLRVRGLPVVAYMDLLAPSVALGAGITRIGCFFNGCCHGVVCDWPWAVRFPAGSLAWNALGDVSVHPTQLYQAAIGFGIAAWLLAWGRLGPPPGSVIAGLCLGLGIQRVVVEALRYGSAGEVWFSSPVGTVTIYQGVGTGLAALGAVVLTRAWRRAPG